MSELPVTRSETLLKEGLAAESSQDYLAALMKYSAALDGAARPIELWSRIGNLLMRLMKWQQAADTFAFILSQEPNNIDALHGLAISNSHLGLLPEALAAADKAKQLSPNNWSIALTHAYILCTLQPDQKTRLDVYRAFGNRFTDPLTAKAANPQTDPSPLRKLRIGYVSGDMKEHSIAFFMEPIFAHHDASQVDATVFSTSKQHDGVTERLKKLVPHWFDVSGMDDDALHRLIRQQRIDILVDLSGHTEGQRLFVFARRAAPIQVTWMGFMGTLGMQAIDYRLTDVSMDPPGHDQWYVEKLFRLQCMACYLPPPDTPLAEEPPLLTNGAPTLISLNNSKKITDDMLMVWGRILASRPDATLILHVQEMTTEDAVTSMQPRLERLGLPLEQIVISPSVPLAEFMQRGLLADIALDTSPVSGGTTTYHALWMGLPIIALDADDAMASSTARTLQALGLGEWVAANTEEYIAKTLALMDDTARLTEHRATSRQKLQASALMGYADRCRDLERAYRLMWFNHLLGRTDYLHSDYDLAEESRRVEAMLNPGSAKVMA